LPEAKEVNVVSELKRIEKSVNVLVGKPVTWAVYGLLLAVRYGICGLACCGCWLRRRYASCGAKP
jgi:hypothetical protein